MDLLTTPEAQILLGGWEWHLEPLACYANAVPLSYTSSGDTGIFKREL
jgi:hypothetical protein